MLYLCATPIGNLGDISSRTIEILNSVDLIAAEDTRHTLKLLNHLGISKPMTSYHEHNKIEKGEYIISLLKEGKDIALVSDAGTPAISDPGEDLVKLCIENELDVTSIPGPVAAINALILSGLSTKRFTFEGFLSVNRRRKKTHLESLKNDTHTLIFYEAPHKLVRTLTDMLEVFGDRNIALVKELTKIHENIFRTTLSKALEFFETTPPKGEFVIVVSGAEEEDTPSEEEWWYGLSITEHVDEYIKKGLSSKDAIKEVSRDIKTPKRDVYNEYHKNPGSDNDEK